ncbi:MAG: hypothetical protein JNL74_09785 [Fibrobacteres bacterium]|nr:hypothetical protein [Fibrobacterota bacterium]
MGLLFYVKIAAALAAAFVLAGCENPVDTNVYKSSVNSYGPFRVWAEYTEVYDTLDGVEAKALDISLCLTHVSGGNEQIDSTERGTYIKLYAEGAMLSSWSSPNSWPVVDAGLIKVLSVSPNDTLRYSDRCRLDKNQLRDSADAYEIKGSILGLQVSTLLYKLL